MLWIVVNGIRIRLEGTGVTVIAKVVSIDKYELYVSIEGLPRFTWIERR